MSEKENGQQLFQRVRIRKTQKGWKVPSLSGMGSYLVRNVGFPEPKLECSCDNFILRKTECKHIYAVEELMTRGSSEGMVSVPVQQRPTYPQDWSAYNQAQTNEKPMFEKLLFDLCCHINDKQYNFGRPSIPLSEMIYVLALKVYSLKSSRRFESELENHITKGHLFNKYTYATMSNYMKDPEITPLLQKLIQLSSLPCRNIEKMFAVDSSGFSTTRFANYFSFKHLRDQKYRTWIKGHICVGVNTNVVTGVVISGEREHDTKFFPSLIETTAENFEIDEVSADKAYSSKKNLELVQSLGGTPFIPFKKNVRTRSRGSGIWKYMLYMTLFEPEKFLDRYHKRSNVETVFHMIKTKFGDYLRSKDDAAKVNELLLKILCHNICVVIHEMFESGISADFVKKADEVSNK